MFQETENCYISEVVASLKKDKTRIRKLNRVDPRTLKRYNVFVPGSKYELVRRGNKIFKNRKELDAAPLDEDNFYHFRYRDKFVTRESKHEWRFVSVFNVDGTFLPPHQTHFKKKFQKLPFNNALAFNINALTMSSPALIYLTCRLIS